MKTLYVIDDDPPLAEAVAEAISGTNRTVRVFDDPLRALSVLSEDPPDLLITDLSMPWLNGAQLIALARLRQPDLPIILMSGYRTASDLAATRHLRFLRKPFDYETLCREVDGIFETKNALRNHRFPSPETASFIEET